MKKHARVNFIGIGKQVPLESQECMIMIECTVKSKLGNPTAALVYMHASDKSTSPCILLLAH